MLQFLTFRARQEFLEYARTLVRLPEPGEGPLDYLLPEARWQELLDREPDPAAWLMALSQATGVYFFPSREWPLTGCCAIFKLSKMTRLLEAGAGRGYLTAALTPLCEAAGIAFRAVDKGDGEFQSGPAGRTPGWSGATSSPRLREFRPEVVLYAWPPPGQSLARICQADFLHYLILVGEAGGGATGEPAGLADPAAPGIAGPEPLRPGPHRTCAPPGDGLLRRPEKQSP